MSFGLLAIYAAIYWTCQAVDHFGFWPVLGCYYLTGVVLTRWARIPS